MSFASTCEEWNAIEAARVRAATFGHMEAEPGSAHKGWFIFINGQHGDMAVIESEFKTFDEGPGYFEDRAEFIWNNIKDSGPCAELGVYRFDGEYRRYKHANDKGLGRFAGAVSKINLKGELKP